MKVAVVGGGISGLGAARALDADHQVTLFERRDRLGGHACTVDVDHYGHTIPVDCGFIVYNRKTYPALTDLFRQLSVKPRATEMEFSVALDEGRFEWAVGSPAAMFAQRRNVVDPRFYRMLVDILRFFRMGTADVLGGTVGQQTLGEYVASHRLGGWFTQRFLVPMCRSIWSSSVDEILGYPAETMLGFLEDHGLLSVRPPIWLTLQGGSRTYVDSIRQGLRGDVRLNADITAIRRSGGQVEVVDAAGNRQHFDKVILACHAPDALAMLAEPTQREAAILGSFRYTRNSVVLHGDDSFMPARRSAWASWNYRGHTDPARNADPVVLTYWMNKIQHIPRQYPLFVTLNPPQPPREGTEFARFDFAHPQFDHAAVQAQQDLPSIQGSANVWFCGAYARYGFHEDGLASGLRAAAAVAQDG
ncbi:MAG: FAD-dependent oxidoreductase [Erythrobacter sp.]|nr:FAD-dependent oxidoreductase [Erythrobacter sp.]